MNNSRKINGNLNVVGNKIRYYREKNSMSYQKLSDELCAFAKCFGISVNDLTDEYFKKLK